MFPFSVTIYKFLVLGFRVLSQLAHQSKNLSFMTTNFDDSSKQLVLLASVCSGILMCKIVSPFGPLDQRCKNLDFLFFFYFTIFVLVLQVYDLTGFISPLLFSAYGKLDGKVRMEWNNRFFIFFIILCCGFKICI